MVKKGILALLVYLFSFLFASTSYASRDCSTLGVSDYNTFKEYCYKVTDAYLELRNSYEVNQVIDSYSANKILDHASVGLNYLPDSLSNKNYYNQLKTAVERGVKYPDDKTIFSEIKTATEAFLSKTTIQQISGKINVYPATGNAPLTVTLRADVDDPTGTKLENYNYTWWIQDGTRRKIIGNRKFLNYTFLEEGNYAVFLDVTSNHRNKQGNVDVLTFSEKVYIKVNEKLASTIIRVNSKSLGGDDTMKFSPEEGAYGLLIDASSSTPASGMKFVKTEWDFGNGVTKSYDGPPKVERVVYAIEGEYQVKLKMTTNSGSIVERDFTIIVRNPIASIKANAFDGFLNDKFTFSANTYTRAENLTFAWEIVDLKKDAIIFNKAASTFSYNFPEKGRYNVKLTVTAPSGEMDYDNRIVYINSRPPVASFTHTVPNQSIPNTIFLDGGASYDLDVSDNGKLEYNWIIDGNRVNLDDASNDGSSGYYTFSSIGNHDVVLEVLDPDDMMDKTSKKITVNSILSVNFFTFPRVTQVGAIAKMVADSPEAEYFEWNFGDGVTQGGRDETITHRYKESGVYDVILTVRDAREKTNSITKKMYVGDAEKPYAHIEVNDGQAPYGFDESACNGEGAYLVTRTKNVSFSADESLDVTGKQQGLKYSWKIGNDYFTKSNVSKRFDELGCKPVKLTIRSDKTGKSDTKETYIDVRNIKPTLSSLDIQVKDPDSDPVVVKVTAVGAEDPDGVIQSYLWYYYTDSTSEPQDFRATRSNSTTFVLPKVTGNYYFVVVMKDNNEERVKSEDITSRYFITLAGDNQNTPIVELKASDTSVAVGEEVTFTVTAKNILTQDVLKDSKIYWDFDGDGFYDKETKKGTVTHKYTKAGENINAKVKVSHKGFSNTRSVQINVSNILSPDFSYISIGNDVIFFNKSSGTIERYIWDMGDGNTVTNNGSFRYTYEDDKPAHIVKLKVEGAGESKETSKKVVRNFKNFIDVKKQDISLFGDLNIKNDTEQIELKEAVPHISLYVKTNKKNAEYYAIDYDTSSDSDMNGGDDDDIDNKNDESYYSGGPAIIPLNEYREQEIKIMVLDTAGNIITAKTITIVKVFVTEEPLNPDEITFDDVPDSVKERFEQIKNEVLNFPKEYRLQGLEYVQRLQGEWNDKRAKTNIILEFEGFIAETGLDPSGDLINILESLLVDADEESSGKDIAATALVNLLPKSINCPAALEAELTNEKICYDVLAEKIRTIQESSDVETNKALAEQVLGAVVADTSMSNKEKVDFKAILKTLVYGGLDEVPEEEVEEVIDNTESGKVDTNSDKSGIADILLTILKWLFYIILGVGGIILLLFLLYKFLNKDKDKSFTDFISEKTSKSKNTTKQEVADVLGTQPIEKEEDFDPLADFASEEEKATETKKDIDFGAFSKKPDKSFESPKQEFSTEGKLHGSSTSPDIMGSETKNDGKVPDWLSGSMGAKTSDEKNEKKTEETQIKAKNDEKQVTNEAPKKATGKVPDWLSGALPDEDKKQEEEKKSDGADKNTEQKENKTLEVQRKINPEENNNSSQSETKKQEESSTKNKAETQDTTNQKTGKVPDWLKGSFDESEKKDEKMEEKKQETSGEEKKEQTTPEVVDAQHIDKKEDDELIINSGVPDWLKASGVTQAKKEEKTSEKQDTKVEAQKIETQEKTTDTSKGADKKEETSQKKEEKTETSPDEKSTAKTMTKKTVEKKAETSSDTKKGEKAEINSEKKEVPASSEKTKTTEETTAKKTSKKTSSEKKDESEKKTETPKKTTRKATKKTSPKKPAKKSAEKTTKEPKLESKEELEDFIKIKDDEIVVHDSDDSLPDWLTGEAKKAKTENEKSEKQKKQETSAEKKADAKEEQKKGDELWDDGMKIPDWLKTDE